jgi:hypothetical protein
MVERLMFQPAYDAHDDEVRCAAVVRENGDYVRHADYATVEAELTRLREENERLTRERDIAVAAGKMAAKLGREYGEYSATRQSAEAGVKVRELIACLTVGNVLHFREVGYLHGWLERIRSELIDALSTLTPAQEPVVTRNDEARYTETVNEDRPYIVRELDGPAAAILDMETRQVIGYRVYDAPAQEPEGAVEEDRDLVDQLTGALRFIMAFYEPGQRYLDTEAWKHAEAGGRAALARGEAVLAARKGREGA